MPTRTISTRLALEGESEYKASLKNINAELQLHKSELEMVEAKYKESANSMDALVAKESALKGSLSALDKKHAEHSATLGKAKAAREKYAQQVEQTKAKLEALKVSTGSTAKQEEALSKELAEAEQKMQQAANSATYYQKQLNYAERDQAKFGTELTKTQTYMGEAKASTDQCATSIDAYGKEVKQAGDKSGEFGDKSKGAINTLSAAIAAAGIVASVAEIAKAVKECTDASIAFESAITGVYKTVDGTPEQLAAISDGIKRISTEVPVAATEIASVAEAAGQLGIATDDVLAFTRVMLDLGVSTNLSADDAASALAKIANITGTTAEDYGRLGAVIVGLGNNFATTERDITEMSTRLASAGTLAGMTEAEIMALAAAMSSVGIDAEAGGTAMTQTLTAIEKAVAEGGDALTEFARISGMSAESFSTTWKDSSVTALQSFIAGLGGLSEKGESATLVLDDLGLSGVRQSNMLKSLALSSENLGRAVELSNQAWVENTALTDEAAKFYNTTEGKMEKMANSFNLVKIAIGDALTPALGELAAAGAAGFDWAAEFIEQNPWLVQAMAGVTVGIIALAGGLTVLENAAIIAATATKLLTVAITVLSAHPLTIAISVAVALVTALGLLAASARDAADGTEHLSAAARDSKEALNAANAAAAEENTNILNMVSALEAAVSQEKKTSAQKATILEMVNQLNTAMPELSLAYDAQTDSLNLTAEAVRALALAEYNRKKQEAATEHLTKLWMDDAAITDKLTAAKENLRAADEKLAAFDGVKVKTEKERYEMELATNAFGLAKMEVEHLEEAQRANTKGIELATASFDAVSGAAEGTAGALSGTASVAEVTAEQMQKLTDQADTLTDSSVQLTGAQDALTAALGEQEKSGSLSLDTALKLIDAGYDSALSIDGETGAITLNRQSYIDLAKSKIDAQIAALELQQSSVNAAIAAKEEAIAVKEAAISHFEYVVAARSAKAAAADADMTALKAQNAATAAQIAALKASRTALDSYVYGQTAASRTSASTAKKQKTQAEKDLAEFKALKATLEHERTMGEIDDAAFYDRLKQARDGYLTDNDNLAERRKIDEELYKGREKLANGATDAEKKALAETTAAEKKAAEEAGKTSKTAYDTSKKWIDKETFYNRLSAKERVLAWERVAARGNLLAEEQEAAARELYTAQQALLDEYGGNLSKALDAHQAKVGDMAEGYKAELEKIKGAYDELMAKQDTMAGKLAEYGDLFKISKNGKMELEDLNKQADVVKKYGETLSKLRENGIADGLLNEVIGMDVDDAITYGQQLLNMANKDDKAWVDYNAAYEAKNKLAIEIAEEFYKGQVDTVKNQMDATLKTALDELGKTTFSEGENIGQELTDGMLAKLEEVKLAAKALSDAAKLDLSGVGLGAKADGSHAGGLSYVPYNGYIAELHAGERVLTADEAKAYVARATPARYDVPTPQDVFSEQAASFARAAMQRQVEQSERSDEPIRLEAVIVMDGAVVARKTYEYNKREERLHGKSLTERG